jgi:hypothetical protein
VRAETRDKVVLAPGTARRSAIKWVKDTCMMNYDALEDPFHAMVREATKTKMVNASEARHSEAAVAIVINQEDIEALLEQTRVEALTELFHEIASSEQGSNATRLNVKVKLFGIREAYDKALACLRSAMETVADGHRKPLTRAQFQGFEYLMSRDCTPSRWFTPFSSSSSSIDDLDMHGVPSFHEIIQSTSGHNHDEDDDDAEKEDNEEDGMKTWVSWRQAQAIFAANEKMDLAFLENVTSDTLHIQSVKDHYALVQSCYHVAFQQVRTYIYIYRGGGDSVLFNRWFVFVHILVLVVVVTVVNMVVVLLLQHLEYRRVCYRDG